MAGYSGTPLAKKLGIKEDFSVALISAPEKFEHALEGLAKGVKITRDPKGKSPFDVLVVFVQSRAELAKRFPPAAARVSEQSGAGVWITWPKKSSGIKTDVTEDVLREVILPSGLVDNKVCAIDDTWSGLRFVRRRS